MMSELQKKESIETVNANFDLVKGDFTTNDANEIVTDLFDKKIQFHNFKKFSQEIRFGNRSHNSKDRIIELKAAKEEAKERVALANKLGKSIHLNCTVTIEIV